MLNILLVNILIVNAQEGSPHMGRPTVQYGIEWGMSASMFGRYHESYYAEEGYIVDEEYIAGCFHLNGSIRGFVGCNIGKRWNISSGISFQGIGKELRSYIVSTYLSYFLDPEDYVFFGLGAGSETEKPYEKSALSTLGYSRRYILTRSLAIDSKVYVQGAYVHPDIYDDGSYVPESRTRKNDAYIVSIGLAIALVF